MFSHEELLVIEEIIDRFAEAWIETRLDQIRVDSILKKLDETINGEN